MGATLDDAAAELAALGAAVEWPSASSGDLAGTVAASVTATAAGRLSGLGEWLATCQGRAPAEPPSRPRLVVIGPVGHQLAPRVEVLAERADCGWRVVEIDPGTADPKAVELGTNVADDEIEAGADLIAVAAGPADVAAAAMTSLLAGVEPVSLLPRGVAAVDTEAWTRTARELRDTRRRVAGRRNNAAALLAALERPQLAFLVGLTLRAAARRTPILLDGGTAAAAALLAGDVQSQAARWWRFADTSADPVTTRVIEQLDVPAVLGLDTGFGDGTAAMLSLPVLIAAALSERRVEETDADD